MDNSSGLALEAEAAPFYVQHAVMSKLPQLTEALDQARELVQAVAVFRVGRMALRA
ncbi:methyl-accepting chemotaxis I protein [Herbaspirillum sp. GW103]|uniref:hypothetical protein n=1 Tax=Herbaspirillum sp. GW103 TaxID=1175306 RepID=UPI00025E26FF|nr:hypothetical protein [Herbaspirillum sp. GW103]EIJ45867.1 methyl-accepting chemotaxis I protein [Herbaspirillum sp. GW103]